MTNVIRVSEAASLGLHTIVLLARTPGRVLNAREISERLGASQAHLSKVLQRLARSGIVRSTRGPRGGFSVDGSGDITLLEVYEAIEGPLSESGCLLREPVCGGGVCILGGLLKSINSRVREYLENTTVSELSDVYGGDEDGG